jgi:hypothetical protein
MPGRQETMGGALPEDFRGLSGTEAVSTCGPELKTPARPISCCGQTTEPSAAPIRNQKVNLTDACITLGARAPIARPNRALVCAPVAGSNRAVVSTEVKLA